MIKIVALQEITKADHMMETEDTTTEEEMTAIMSLHK